MQLNGINIDYSNLSTDDLNKLIVHLIDVRSNKINNMGDAGYGVIQDTVCAAVVTEHGSLLPYSAQSTIRACCEETDKKLAAGLLASLKNGCSVAQCVLVPVRVYGLAELSHSGYLNNVAGHPKPSNETVTTKHFEL